MMEFNMEALAHLLKSERLHTLAAGYRLLQPHIVCIYILIYTRMI